MSKPVGMHVYMLIGTNVGTHDAPIRCVEYCPDVNVIISGSWDSTVKLWDPRTPCSAGSFSQPDKVSPSAIPNTFDAPRLKQNYEFSDLPMTLSHSQHF